MSFHAWYSAAQDMKFGHVVYKDKNGLEIKCTEVDERPEQFSKWNDAIYVGEVETFVRNAQRNEMDDMDPYQLLNRVQDALAEETRCKAQFASTGKCFCFGCPIKRYAN
jgi:hypothetical protein